MVIANMVEGGFREMKRHWQKAFLAALENTGSVTAAAEAAGVHRTAAYKHRQTDKQFSQQWDEALERGADVLEDEARRRALEGVDEPVFYKGEKVGTVKKYSDLCLIFLLKGLRPQRWRESRASMAPAELNKMIEVELKRLAAKNEAELSEAVN